MTQLAETYDVMAFGAHPDDCEMGMAGTLALLTASGRRVLTVVMTGSEMSTHGDPATRRAEFQAANRVLGCDGLMLDLPDTGVRNIPENRERIVHLVRAHRPQIVFAPYHTNQAGHHDGRANVDHMETGRLVRDGLKLARLVRVLPQLPAHDVRRILYYMVPQDTRPSIVVDVTAVEEKIREAVRAYRSQMVIVRAGSAIEDILFLGRRVAGLQIGVRLGEAFLTDQVPDLRVGELFR